MNKYHNKKVVVDGITFDSKSEAQRYEELKLLKKAGEIESFVIQPEFELQPSFKKDGQKYRAIKYRADFEVLYKDGTVEIEDVKGMETQLFKLKAKMFDYKYPDKKLIVIK
jgi:hypothetical protein